MISKKTICYWIVELIPIDSDKYHIIPCLSELDGLISRIGGIKLPRPNKQPHHFDSSHKSENQILMLRSPNTFDPNTFTNPVDQPVHTFLAALEPCSLLEKKIKGHSIANHISTRVHAEMSSRPRLSNLPSSKRIVF